MARTGQNEVGASIQPAVSINDSGAVAFVAASGTFQDVFVATAPGVVTGVADLVANNRTYGNELQINNSNQVAAVAITSGSTALRQARIYDGNAVGSFSNVGRASSPLTNSNNFDSIGAFASMTNDGQLAFAGLESDVPVPPSASSWEIHLADGSPVVDRRDLINDLPTGARSEVVQLSAAPAFFRFMAADGDRVVVGSRDGAAGTPGVPKRIVWYDITGIDTLETIASTASGLWSDLGVRPGISDDGDAVAFYGNLSSSGATAYSLQPGPGVFLATRTLAGFDIHRITGVLNNGFIDPGETFIDANSNYIFDAGEFEIGVFSGFDPDSRVGVTRGGQSINVTYLCLNSGNRGIYTSTFTDFDGLPPQVSGWTLVAEGGDAIAGLSGTISNLTLHDPINNRGQVGFWVSMSSGTQAVLRANAIGSIMFREQSGDEKDGTWGLVGVDEIPGWDHVGFQFGNRVSESHPGYPAGNAYDPIEDVFVPIPAVNGVQTVHTRGSFSHDSPAPGVSTVIRYDAVPIPAQLAEDMSTIINTRLGAGFGLIDYTGASTGGNVLAGITNTLSPSAQKGSSGTFTCVGLVEWAAEQAGYQAGEGFVPDSLESITIGSNTIPFLSPELLYYALTHSSAAYGAVSWIQGFFDPVDFILTDPSGRRIGHTANFGTLNEIPTALYTGDGAIEQLLILDPQPGVYTLQLFGLNATAIAAIGGTFAGLLTNEYLAAGEERVFTISVGSGNATPAAINDTAATLRPNSVTINVLGNDSDPDGTLDPTRVAIGTGPANGSVSVNPTTGAITYTPNAGFIGIDTFTYTVRDNVGAISNVATVTVQVNNRPPVATGDSVTTALGRPVLVSVLTNDVDPDGSLDPASVAVVGAPANGSVSVNPTTGAITYTPNGGFSGIDSFTYTVKDNDGAVSNGASVSVTVVNQAPVLGFIGSRNVAEGGPLTFTAAATDPDLPAQGLTFSLLNAPVGAAINPATGAFSWTPTEAQGPGTFTFDVRVTEGFLTDSETITVTVAEVNVAPVIGVPGPQTVSELSTLAFTVSATDTDLPTNTLTFSASGLPAGASFDPTTGAFSWTPTEAQGPGSYIVTFFVSDNGSPALSDSRTVVINVGEVNQAPVLGFIGNRSVAEGGTLTFTAAATDPDLPAQGLTFSLLNAPAGAVINPATGAFSWTPSTAGTFTFDVRVTDGLLTDSETITVTVAPAPQVTDVRVRFGSQSFSLLGNTRILPWTSITAIEIVFDQDVTIDANDLRLTGVNVSLYGGTFGYNAATRTATWTLASPIGPDRLTFSLDGDAAGGDSNDGVRTAGGVYLRGGDYALTFSVLPGDFNGDGIVTLQDSVAVRNHSPGFGIYLLWADLDGDGDVDINDINAPRRRLGWRLP